MVQLSIEEEAVYKGFERMQELYNVAYVHFNNLIINYSIRPMKTNKKTLPTRLVFYKAN